MRWDALPSVGLLLLGALPAYADFTEFYFAGNEGNSSVVRTCPSWEIAFECAAPSVCSFDAKTQKYYCCVPGASDAVCWGPKDGCDGGDDVTPSGSQQACSSGSNTFCCLKSSETCTETADQVNICWSTLKDPLAPLNATALNETAKSLEAAHPSASTYAISLSAIQALTSTTAGSSSTSTSSPASSSASATQSAITAASASASATATGHPDPGLSGGAIGGIVGGVVGGLALLGLAGFLFWRRRRSAKNNPYAPAESHNAPSYDASAYSPGELASPVGEIDSGQTYYHEAPITEKYRHDTVSPVAEVPADGGPVELPAERHYEK